MRSDLIARLRSWYRRPAAGQAEHQRAHEDELMAAFGRASGGQAPVERKRWFPRLAIAGGLTLATVGACALPAEYPMSLGHGLEISVDAEHMDEVEPEQIALYLRDELAAERVEIHMSRSIEERTGPDGEVDVHEEVRLQLFAFGGETDAEEGWQELQDEFPALADAEIHEVPLEGTVYGTLGGKLSRNLLDLTIDRDGVEAAERQILAELLAQGFDPSQARVDIKRVQGDFGNEEIEVRVEAKAPLDH